MQNSPLEHSAILLTFIKLSFVIEIFVSPIFEWPFYTGFTVLAQGQVNCHNVLVQRKESMNNKHCRVDSRLWECDNYAFLTILAQNFKFPA